MKEDRKEFLRGLARLTKRYGFVIGGCGCCGSPFVDKAGSSGGYDLEWDPKTETYSLGGA